MKHTKEEYEAAVSNSSSIASVCRRLGVKPTGGNYRIIHKAIEEYNLDTSHFTGQGWNVGLKFKPKRATEIKDILKKGSYYQSYKLKRRLLKENLKEKCCECCGLFQWQGKEIPLELHHVNGDNRDNRIENLQLLCPNCHALTDNYRGLNKSAHQETGDVELP
jgi:hypothetical protein